MAPCIMSFYDPLGSSNIAKYIVWDKYWMCYTVYANIGKEFIPLFSIFLEFIPRLTNKNSLQKNYFYIACFL